MDYQMWKEMFDSSWRIEGNSFITFLLDAGLEINALNKDGKTLLSYAAECGNLQMAEFLLQEGGADAVGANSDGAKPLHVAAQYGRKDIVNLFLDRGISVDICDNDECTPLHYVAGKSDFSLAGGYVSFKEIVHILVDRNANIDAENIDGLTPLVLAAQTNRRPLVELFIQLGANLECTDAGKNTVLHHACRNGWTGIVRTLVEGRFDIDLNAKDSLGRSPAHIAAAEGDEHIVKLLVENGAEANSKCRGVTLMHFACQYGWCNLVTLLLSKGCDLNARSEDGSTPLMFSAVSRVDRGFFKFLHECGADVKCCNNRGWTVLHNACRHASVGVVKLLTEKGCDVNARTVNNDTPLHAAANGSWGTLNKMEHLLNAGADCNAVNNQGKTAFLIFFLAFFWGGRVASFDTLKMIILFLRSGFYFRTDDYAVIDNTDSFKAGILQNTELCTMAFINKFNNGDLRAVYEIPGVSCRLPPIERLKISSPEIVRDIEESVKCEIRQKGFCDVMNVRPIVLRRFCVLALVRHYNV